MISSSCTAAPLGCASTMDPSSPRRPSWTGAWHIQPGKPDQNAFIERFNRTFREEVLDAYLFDSLEQVREITEAWLATYNTEQHHDSLGRVPPLTFRPRSESPLESTVGVST